MLALVAPARADTINAIVGDASWIAAFGSAPDANADETLRIQIHLAYVLDRLRERDVTDLPATTRHRRAAALDSLERYVARGEFPLRTDDRLPGRRPRFIDARGVHCAVGQLIADSGAEDLARRINATYEYAFVHEMHAPELLAWATRSGFTIDELAMIQPGYDLPPTADRMRRTITTSMERITLQCAAHDPPPAKLAIRAHGDKSGRMTVTTTSTDPFARCFVAAASLLEHRTGAYKIDPAPIYAPYALKQSQTSTTPMFLRLRNASRAS